MNSEGSIGAWQYEMEAEDAFCGFSGAPWIAADFIPRFLERNGGIKTAGIGIRRHHILASLEAADAFRGFDRKRGKF